MVRIVLLLLDGWNGVVLMYGGWLGYWWWFVVGCLECVVVSGVYVIVSVCCVMYFFCEKLIWINLLMLLFVIGVGSGVMQVEIVKFEVGFCEYVGVGLVVVDCVCFGCVCFWFL